MLKVGITGGIGSGKTTLTNWLESRGVNVVDADEAARIVVEPGKPALEEIADHFGRHFIGADGQLNRASMRELVFFNEDASVRIRNVSILVVWIS